MTKTFCDRCGIKITGVAHKAGYQDMNPITYHRPVYWALCFSCLLSLKEWIREYV